MRSALVGLLRLSVVWVVCVVAIIGLGVDPAGAVVHRNIGRRCFGDNVHYRVCAWLNVDSNGKVRGWGSMEDLTDGVDYIAAQTYTVHLSDEAYWYPGARVEGL